MRYALITRHGLYRAEVERDELDAIVDCGADECDWAIEQDGWCGTFIDVEPVVVIETNDYQRNGETVLPADATIYLMQSRV